MPQALAAAMGVAEEPGRPLTETLARHLASRRALVLLDNGEHLVEAMATLADALGTAASRLGVLATSREPLRVDGELGWSTPTLPCLTGTTFLPRP